jgi:hypothetical protein
MIKPRIFEFFHTPAALAERFDPTESQHYFNAYLDLLASAEQAGFEAANIISVPATRRRPIS